MKGMCTLLVAVMAVLLLRSANAQTSYTFQDIGTLNPNTQTTARAVNNWGEVVGLSNNTGFYWSAQTGIVIESATSGAPDHLARIRLRSTISATSSASPGRPPRCMHSFGVPSPDP